jgi:hypothetical protein
MPHEQEELDDEVAAGVICPKPKCGASRVSEHRKRHGSSATIIL